MYQNLGLKFHSQNALMLFVKHWPTQVYILIVTMLSTLSLWLLLPVFAFHLILFRKHRIYHVKSSQISFIYSANSQRNCLTLFIQPKPIFLPCEHVIVAVKRAASHSGWFSLVLMALLLQQLHGWGRGGVTALLVAHHCTSAGRSHLRLLPACRLTVQRVVETWKKQTQKHTHTQSQKHKHTHAQWLPSESSCTFWFWVYCCI